MTAPRLLLGLALIVAIGAGGLLLLRPWESPPSGEAVDRESAGPSAAPRAESLAEVLTNIRSAVVLRGAPPADRPLAPTEGGLYGLVLDEATGAPVPGVTVHALRLDWYHGKFALLGSAVSDAEGRYRLRGLEKSWEDTGTLALGNGWASGLVSESQVLGFATQPTSLCFEVAEGEWIPFDVHVRSAVRIHGTVYRPGGSPASGATVHLDVARDGPYFPWDLLPPVRCDEHGRYELTAFPRQVWTARLEGYVDAVAEVLPAGGTLDLRFEAPHQARIRVVDSATGSAVEGAEVCFAWPRIGPQHEAETAVYILTDAAGVAALEPVPDDGFRVKARKDGYVTYGYTRAVHWGRIAEESAPGAWTGTARMVALKTVEGRVEWPPGGDLPNVAFVRSEGETRHLNSVFRGYTDVEADGSFRIRVPPDGTHRLTFHANDAGDAWSAAAELQADVTEVVLRPVLTKRHEVVDRSRWGRWTLTLRDAQGRPLTSALINDEGPARSSVSPSLPEEELEGGRVEVLVEPGDESVWLCVRFARTVDDEELGALLVGPLGPEGGVRDVVFPEPRSLTGRVLAQDGYPLQGVEVWATPIASVGELCWRHDATLTDANGRFVLRNLLEERYDVVVSPTDTWVLPAAQRADAGATDLVFRLLTALTCAITVQDAGGLAVEDAFVTLRQRDGVGGPDADRDGIHVWTDAGGGVRIEGLEAGGLYDLRIKPPDGYPDLLAHVVQRWTPRDEVVTLANGLTVKGIVRDAVGRPMARVEVRLEHPGGHRVTTSDGIGRFTFRRLPPGHVRLDACFLEEHEEGWAPAFEAAALAGDEGVELRLDSARDLHVRVEIPDGVEFGLQTIDLTPAEAGAPGTRKRVWISEQGAALFRGLEPNRRYRLWGGPTEAGRYVLAEIDAEQTSVLASLAEGGQIAGRLLLPPGAERCGVKIVKRGFHCHAKPLPRGEFQLVGVPPGEWTLEAWCFVSGGRRFVRRTAQAGDEPSIDLTSP